MCRFGKFVLLSLLCLGATDSGLLAEKPPLSEFEPGGPLPEAVNGASNPGEVEVSEAGVVFDVPDGERPGFAGRGWMVVWSNTMGPTTLAEGEELIVEATYRFEEENADDWGLRLMVLNTDGGAWTDQIHGFNDARISSWSAVGARAAMGSTDGKRCAITRRMESGSNLLNAGGYENLSPPVRQTSGLSPGESHSARLTILLESGNRVRVTSTLGTEGLEAEFEAEGPVTFDAAGIFPSRPCGKFTVESFRVTLVR